MGLFLFLAFYIHPGSLFVQKQRCAAAADSIPTAIFHWERDCSPLADWTGGAKEEADLRTARLVGEEPVGEKREAARGSSSVRTDDAHP